MRATSTSGVLPIIASTLRKVGIGRISHATGATMPSAVRRRNGLEIARLLPGHIDLTSRSHRYHGNRRSAATFKRPRPSCGHIQILISQGLTEFVSEADHSTMESGQHDE